MRQLRQHDLRQVADIVPPPAANLYAADPRARRWLAEVQGCPDLTPVAKVIATVIVCQEARPDGAARWCLPQFCEVLAMDMREVLGALADLAYGRWLDCRDGCWVLQRGSEERHGVHP